MPAERPKYKFSLESHVDGVLIPKGTTATVSTRHIPGPHWEPLNDAAKAIAKKAGIKFDGDRAFGNDFDKEDEIDTSAADPLPADPDAPVIDK